MAAPKFEQVDDLNDATSRLASLTTASDALSSADVNSITICFVDSVAGVRAASAAVMHSGAISIDLEGIDLGRTGRISTLQMCDGDTSQSSERGERNKSTVYVIDVASLGSAAFESDNGLRSLLESVVDVQLLAVTKQMLTCKSMVHLPGLGGMFAGPGSVLSFDEKRRMNEIREKARKLYLPKCGGSFDAWLARPLSSVLLEYSADVRFFGSLRETLSQVEEQFGCALKSAVEGRIRSAQAPTFSNGDHLSRVEDELWTAVMREAAPELKMRLESAYQESQRLLILPIQLRIKERDVQKDAMREALELLSWRQYSESVSNRDLWQVCSFVASHNRWFEDAEWTEFMREAASSSLLSDNQRSTMSRWLNSGGPRKGGWSRKGGEYKEDSDDDWGSSGYGSGGSYSS